MCVQGMLRHLEADLSSSTSKRTLPTSGIPGGGAGSAGTEVEAAHMKNVKCSIVQHLM
jgi:hypothetical protein